MRKRNLRYTGTEINCERWILLLWQHSEVVDDYFLTPQASQDQKSPLLLIVISTALYSCKSLFGLCHLTIPTTLPPFCSCQQFFLLIRSWHHLLKPKPCYLVIFIYLVSFLFVFLNFYNVVLVSAIQHESAIIINIFLPLEPPSPPCSPPLQVIIEHQKGFPLLYNNFFLSDINIHIDGSSNSF